MNEGYAVFCDADRKFYDAPHRLAEDGDGPGRPYEAGRREAPAGWQRNRKGDWLAYRPLEGRLPAQGWKIHISACLDNAEKVLDQVWDYCVPRGIAFKFVPSRYLLHTRNAKYADRAGSGKFITVYPADDAQCKAVAEDLDVLLAGEPGPYILSDLRWGAGPVHVRYGSFTERHCRDEQGELRPAVEDASGRLVPDVRGPAFHVPDWVTLPDFLRPHAEARAATTTDGIPYTIERALHFSNGGGVYVGRDDRTGRRVVLKEGRPHAGLAADGADAVTRLERERDALEQLAGLSCTPEVLDWFALGDHRFLVLEYIEGRPLNSFFARRHPLIEEDPGDRALAAYTQWALRIHRLVEDAVAQVHARGVVFNDLHLFNIMVTDDESSVVLLDFEAAAPIEEGRRQVIANPGFVAPADRRGADIDRYALACLRLALFLPLTNLFAVDRAKAAHLADIVAENFPVDRAFLDEAVAEITRGHPSAEPARMHRADHLPLEPGPSAEPAGVHRADYLPLEPGPSAEPAGVHRAADHLPLEPGPSAEPVRVPRADYLPLEPGDWPHSRDSMADAIRASARFGRDDRCLPGDIAQFATPVGGACFAHGAAGVLYALAETGCGTWPEAEEWLLRSVRRPASGSPLGFYDGLAGIAWTLDHLGHRAAAMDLLEVVLAEDWTDMGPDLHSGLAGIGLALDALAESTGESSLREAALECSRLVARAAAADRGRPAGRAGLLHGASGAALLHLRLFERTGDPALLGLAADALHRDLDRCVRSAGGALQVDEGWRTMPYLGAGSAGVGMVLDDWLVHGDDERFTRARQEIVGAAQAKFYAQPGLFRGAAGMVLYLSRTAATGPGTSPADLARQIGVLSWHALPYEGHLAFPGEQMMRLSMDLATGTAGCLLALGAALDDAPVQLPFLPRVSPGRSRGPQS
ncbi:class III lanthionine synthetase LanKC [Streptomyces sp. NPDC006678]|uniref:class III lanthionine synthetase LanKC n=1 Tax=Streptomyces sp. NPDC006678 TaxID=3157185 RepID=UPI0033C4BA40